MSMAIIKSVDHPSDLEDSCHNSELPILPIPSG